MRSGQAPPVTGIEPGSQTDRNDDVGSERVYSARAQGIWVRNIRKRFRSVQAIHEANLEVAPREVVALVGANGAGKSTLLRILGTTIIADEGEARIGGIDVSENPKGARRATGLLLAEERSWYWRLTGRQNLQFFATLHGLSGQAVKRRATDLLEECGLTDAADRRFYEYSSGMRLRLSLARALISEPAALLLDEPTRSLDPVATEHFHDQLAALVQARGTAVLVATHDLHEAASIAGRALLMREGRVEVASAPGETLSSEALAKLLSSRGA